MNKKLGLSLAVTLLSTVFPLSVEASTEEQTQDDVRQQLERTFSDSEQNSLWFSWIEAFNIDFNNQTSPTRPTPNPEPTQSIAHIYEYELEGKPAVTLYVRQIPIFTFLNQDATETATKIRDRINQLYRNNVDPETITAHWNPDLKAYTINVEDEIFLTMTDNIILADTTKNQSEDTRHATNRLRRLLGVNPAEPLTEVAGEPAPEPPPAPTFTQQVIREIRGVASWYGPGFHGRLSASWERFNQNALTAAHKTLPFGTRIRVTNLNNGKVVVVRINDRGPYSGNRILDLSAEAARQIGMISSGVAPVKIEILR